LHSHLHPLRQGVQQNLSGPTLPPMNRHDSLYAGIDIGSLCDQELHDIAGCCDPRWRCFFRNIGQRKPFQCLMERRPARFSHRIDICPLAKKQYDCFFLAIIGCHMKRRISVSTACVDISTACNKKFRGLIGSPDAAHRGGLGLLYDQAD